MSVKKSTPNVSNTKRKAGVVTLKDADAQVSPQGQKLIVHVNNALIGSHGIASCVVVMPPGAKAKTHLHNKHELIVVCVEGHAATLVGPEMKPLFHGPGDFLFVPPGVEHTAVNLSTTDRLVAFEIRTDPHFNEDIEMSPHLEGQAQKVIDDLRAKIAAGKQKLPAHWSDISDKEARVYRFS